MAEWLVSGNPRKYDVVGAFRELHKVDWKQTTNVQENDIVYIYVSADVQQVKFKCRANKVNLTIPDIDDNKYNISGEYDGSAGRYMELELLEEFDTDLFSRLALEKHGFSAPQSPVRVAAELKAYLDVVQYILSSEDLIPDDHDGSYELVREVIKCYGSMKDLSAIDYKDLNLVYLMSVGTWKHGVAVKRSTIEESNLPKSEKERLQNVLNSVWEKAELGTYSNREKGVASLGMFGTGFNTFRDKTDDISPRKFIQMCIDIMEMDDDNKILERCSEDLNAEFKGMKAASASMVLHCLKPFMFPVFNSNMGNKNIFEYFGVELKAKAELSHYVNNVREVIKFRNKNFSLKNFRVFDIASRMIGNFDNTTPLNDDFWPSLDIYNPNISKDDWMKYINEVEKPNHPSPMKMLVAMLELGGQASCKQLSEIYGGNSTAYVGCALNLGKRVKKYFEKPGCMDGDKERYFSLPFQGKNIASESGEYYVYRIRPELKAALEEMDLTMFSPYYDDNEKEVEDVTDVQFAKNMILYGPPGTGKTYSTVVYAVAIIEGKTFDEVKEESYTEVLKRYNQYKEEGLIAFTTFHQSYGYEEFIEGIRPVLDDSDEEQNNLQYQITPGLFKAFCDRASRPSLKQAKQDIGLNSSPNIWKVSLEGTGENKTRTECLENGHIRIGYDKYGENITDETIYDVGGKTVVSAFVSKMRIGDIVLSCFSSTTIDAIGVITSDYEWHDEYDNYKRLRKVNWLVKDIKEDVVEINNGKTLTTGSVYKLNIQLANIMNIITKYAADTIEVEEAKKNYVFVIDEINRGNISKIFGELITLIEETKRTGMDEETSVTLPYSGEKFSVPSNVHILGTMNTADRSIALMDTALRRRFQFVEMMPDTNVLRDLGADKVGDLDVALMLEKINERITYLYDREHTIGHAFFTKIAKVPTVETLAEIFSKSIIPLLQEYFYEDYNKIQLVLGDNAKIDDNHKFILDTDVKVRNVFKGNVDDIDLPEKKYELNKEALYNIQSYIEII